MFKEFSNDLGSLAILKLPELGIAVLVIGLAVAPQCAQAVFETRGSIDAPYRAYGEQFPNTLWMQGTANGSIYYASAVRINEHCAITAGHLVKGSSGLFQINMVGNGSSYLTNMGTVVTVTNVTVNPAYTGSGTMDVAFLWFGQSLPGINLTFGTNNVVAQQVVAGSGYGRWGTPAGLQPNDGTRRALNAPVDPSSTDFLGYPGQLYFGVLFSPSILVSLNGAGLAGDSGGGVYDTSGDFVGINIAEFGGLSDIAETIVLRSSAFLPWLQQLTPDDRLLHFRQEGANLILSWEGALTLQSSSQVSGPYSDVQGASNPYTNSISGNTNGFFRLRLPQ
jgi:hypothetical protein